MLPDFPSTKREMERILIAYFAQQVRKRCPGLEDVSRHRMFEGRRDAISREGETAEETKIFEAAAEMMISPEEVARFDMSSMKAKMDEAANKMAEQMTKHFYETLSEICEKTGQVTKGGGGFTADRVLEALDKIYIDFEPDGTPRMPSIHVAPSQFVALRAALEKLATDPEYVKKQEELLERKFRDWCDREASRKLVG